MRSLPAGLAAALESDAHGDIIQLVEITLPSGTIYRTNWNEPVSFQPEGHSAAHTYVPDDVSWGEIRASAAQESPSVDLRLQNVRDPVTGAARHWATVLAAVTATAAVNGSAVAWRIVKGSMLGTPAAQVHEEGWALNRPVLEDNDVRFSCGPEYDIFALETPVPPLKAPRCRYQWKDADCRAQGPQIACAKSLSECTVRHGAQRARISQTPYHDARLTRVA